MVMILTERWQELRSIPKVMLGQGPTPIQMLSPNLWVKREDHYGPTYGGNKTRKLEWWLGHIQTTGAKAILTTGSSGSHHALATTLFVKQLSQATNTQLETHLLLTPTLANEHVTRNFAAMVEAGATIHPLSHTRWIGLKRRHLTHSLHTRFKNPNEILFLPGGGTHPIGIMGCIEIGLEIGQAIFEKQLPEPECMVIALGTGGTTAGLALGLSAVGLRVPIVAVQVSNHIDRDPNLLKKHIHALIHHAKTVDHRFPNIGASALQLIQLDRSAYGQGYGHPTQESFRAIETAQQHGLPMESTYTGKAFARALDLAKKAPVLYIHTLGDLHKEMNTHTETKERVQLKQWAEKYPVLFNWS